MHFALSNKDCRVYTNVSMKQMISYMYLVISCIVTLSCSPMFYCTQVTHVYEHKLCTCILHLISHTFERRVTKYLPITDVQDLCVFISVNIARMQNLYLYCNAINIIPAISFCTYAKEIVFFNDFVQKVIHYVGSILFVSIQAQSLASMLNMCSKWTRSGKSNTQIWIDLSHQIFQNLFVLADIYIYITYISTYFDCILKCIIFVVRRCALSSYSILCIALTISMRNR